MTGRSRRSLAVLATLAAAASLTACGSGGDADGGDDDIGDPVGERMETITPARIVDRPQGFVSSDVLSPVENAWRAGGEESFTEVDAGSLAADRKRGALLIFRHDFLTAEQTGELVEVRAAVGPLRITDAPEGAGVVESAQEDGEIGFVGRDGTRGTLELSDDTVRTAGD